jgi:hypothetical protein
MLDISRPLKTRDGVYKVTRVIKKDNASAIYPICVDLQKQDGALRFEEYTEEGFYNEDWEDHHLDLVYDNEIEKTKENTMLDLKKPLRTRDGRYKVKKIEITKAPIKHNEHIYDIWALLVAEDGEERNCSYTREGLYNKDKGETDLDLVYDSSETQAEVLTTFADDLNDIRTKISALDVLANEEFVKKLGANDSISVSVVQILIDDISRTIYLLINNTKNRG